MTEKGVMKEREDVVKAAMLWEEAAKKIGKDKMIAFTEAKLKKDIASGRLPSHVVALIRAALGLDE